MKVILFAALIACVAYTHAQLPTCPKPDPDGGAVHLANPSNCATFYQCTDVNEPILLNCFPGTWFNPLAGVCDWPVNVPEGVCIPPPPEVEE